MTWAVFFAALAGPLAKRVLVALGMGVITYAGWATVQGQISSAVTGALGGIGASVYQVLALAGFVDCIGIWLAAITTAVTLMTVKRLGVLSS